MKSAATSELIGSTVEDPEISMDSPLEPPPEPSPDALSLSSLLHAAENKAKPATSAKVVGTLLGDKPPSVVASTFFIGNDGTECRYTPGEARLSKG